MPKNFYFITAVLMAGCGLWMPAAVRADALRLNTELGYRTTFGETTDKATGEKTETDSSQFTERFNLRMLKEIYPYLFLDGGGIFTWEQTDSTVGETSREHRERMLQPYLALELNNPLYQAGLGYRRVENRETAQDTTTRFLEEYTASLGWRPAGFPRVDLDYTRTLLHNEPLTTEQVNDRFGLRTTYAYREYNFDYLYNRNWTEQTQHEPEPLSASERASVSETLSTSHDGRVRYSRRFLGDRLAVNAGTRLSRSTAELIGRGEVQLRTQDLGNPFAIPPLQADAEASSNTLNQFSELPFNLNTTIGITNPVAVGLRFAESTEIDTVFVLTSSGDESASPTQIDRLNFTWQVFISNDEPPNDTTLINWTPVPLEAADYDPFQNRFEINFRQIEARLVKVVLFPPADDELELIQPITLAGVEGYTTLAGRPGSEFETFSQEYTLNLAYRFSPNTSGRYYLRYSNRQTEPTDSESTYVSHTAGLNHILNRIFTANGQFTWSDSRQNEREATTYSYAASLLGRYLPTLRQSLSYSGSTSREESGTSTNNSVLLRNVADLYPGWSAFIDFGYGWNEQSNGNETTSKLMRTGTNIVPNRRMNFNLDYELSRSSQTDQAEITRQRVNFRASLLPFRTVRLSALIFATEEKGRQEDSSVTQQYSIGWNPFPDGALQFGVSYNQSQLVDSELESYGAQIRWRVAPRIFLNTRYSNGTTDSETEVRDFQSISTTLKILY